MLITSISNPRYANAGGTAIFASVMLDGAAGSHDYLFVNGDAAGQTYFDALKAGDYGVIAAYVAPAPRVPTATQLRAYANGKAEALRKVSRTYALTGGLSVKCDATPNTGIDLQALMVWGAAHAEATTNFVQNDGGVVTLTGAQCVELANAIIAYGQSVFAMLATAMNSISNGTITTTAQIDALSWPA